MKEESLLMVTNRSFIYFFLVGSFKVKVYTNYPNILPNSYKLLTKPNNAMFLSLIMCNKLFAL